MKANSGNCLLGPCATLGLLPANIASEIFIAVKFSTKIYNFLHIFHIAPNKLFNGARGPPGAYFMPYSPAPGKPSQAAG